MSGICSACAGAVLSSTLRSLPCAGLSASASLVSSRITLWRPAFTTFGSCVTHQKLLLSRLDSDNSRERSKGSINRARSRACVGVIPRGKKLGRALPDRCAPAAVVFKIAGKWRNFEG